MANTRTRTKGAVAYDALRNLLREGEFSPGERITESRIAELLDTSRGAAREAILKLESEGLFEGRGAYCGKYVRLIEDENKQQALWHYQVREVIEGLAARLAADNMTGSQIRELERLWQRESKTLIAGDSKAIIEASIDFHRFLIANCGNPLLLNVWEAYYLMPLAVRTSALEERIRANVSNGTPIGQEYGPVVEAIAPYDPDEAEIRMKKAVRRMTDAIDRTTWSGSPTANE